MDDLGLAHTASALPLVALGVHTCVACVVCYRVRVRLAGVEGRPEYGFEAVGGVHTWVCVCRVVDTVCARGFVVRGSAGRQVRKWVAWVCTRAAVVRMRVATWVVYSLE